MPGFESNNQRVDERVSRSQWRLKVRKVESWIDNYQTLHNSCTIGNTSTSSKHKSRKLEVDLPLGTGEGSILDQSDGDGDDAYTLCEYHRAITGIQWITSKVEPFAKGIFQDIIELIAGHIGDEKKFSQEIAFKVGIYGVVVDEKHKPLLKKYYRDYDLGRILWRVLKDRDLLKKLLPFLTQWCTESAGFVILKPFLRAAEMEYYKTIKDTGDVYDLIVKNYERDVLEAIVPVVMNHEKLSELDAEFLEVELINCKYQFEQHFYLKIILRISEYEITKPIKNLKKLTHDDQYRLKQITLMNAMAKYLSYRDWNERDFQQVEENFFQQLFKICESMPNVCSVLKIFYAFVMNDTSYIHQQSVDEEDWDLMKRCVVKIDDFKVLPKFVEFISKIQLGLPPGVMPKPRPEWERQFISRTSFFGIRASVQELKI